jgi:anhydro-N-acetylmuramic acid kinase
MNKNLYSLGLMSGTSMDGIDASIIKSDGEQSVEIIDDLYIKYDDIFRTELKKCINLCKTNKDIKKITKRIKKLEKELTLYHAKACQLIIKKNKKIKVDLIGFHGQTILHEPKKGYSKQIGDSNLLSKIINTTVISNFRKNDILNGGQGAPLTPLYHKLILSKVSSNYPSAIINIGGIANITYVKNKKQLVSFDTGPGNCLIDKWVEKNSSMHFDKMGKLAKSGKLDQKILNQFLQDSYYKKKFPKSLDIKHFDLNSLKKLSLEDGSTTLSILTVETICLAIKSLKVLPNIIILSGGGRKNKFIIENIKKRINKSINLIDEFNFDGDFIESQAFAYLAIRSFYNKYITLPSTTGVKMYCTGGSIFKIK